MSGVTVLGSLNVDEIATVPRLPAPGETVLATGLMRRPGGKGANQAVAAARAGARVRMVGATGDDAGDALLRTALTADDVDTSALRCVAGEPTGLAVVTVQDDGENTITVVSGANAALRHDDVATACEPLATGDTLLLQLEVPLAVVVEAARLASTAGARVVLNAAPARPVDDAARRRRRPGGQRARVPRARRCAGGPDGRRGSPGAGARAAGRGHPGCRRRRVDVGCDAGGAPGPAGTRRGHDRGRRHVHRLPGRGARPWAGHR